MAENLTYGMGQLRYAGNPSSYKTLMTDDDNFFQKVKKKILTNPAECYQDVVLKIKSDSSDSGKFVYNNPYLLHLEIPRDLIYSCRYYLKLVNVTDDWNSPIDITNINYQLIKTILVPRAESNQGNNSKVVLYPVDGNGNPWNSGEDTEQADVKVGIATPYDENKTYSRGDIVEYKEDYYVWDAGNDIENQLKIRTKVDTILEWTWLTNAEKSAGVVNFDIVFTPRSKTYLYNGVLIEMVRSSFDYDIYNTNGTYGRFIDTDAKDGDKCRFKAKIYKLKNLIKQEGGTSGLNPLNNIGVYSHPNLIMAINGEEIRTGQSGYYELNDFDITSLAFYPVDEYDKFTLDYQWVNE